MKMNEVLFHNLVAIMEKTCSCNKGNKKKFSRLQLNQKVCGFLCATGEFSSVIFVSCVAYPVKTESATIQQEKG